MVVAVPRTVVVAYYDAIATRDPERIAPFLADDVEWMIAGPVDLIHFCGMRRGKAAVLDFFKTIVPPVLRVTDLHPTILLVDGDRAAALVRVSAIQNATGRVISYCGAQFLRFRDGLLIQLHALIDSFDAAEQVLGRRLDTTAPALDDAEAGTALVHL